MVYEIVEALEEYYAEDEEMIVDCLLYLKENATKKEKELIERTFEDMDRCCDCGAKLEIAEYQEIHTELDGNLIEYLSDYYCPNCDY